MSQVIAIMIVIIVLGFVIDGLIFKNIEKRLQQRWGLVPA
jgi:NitT/TauT family transport system permease protein